MIGMLLGNWKLIIAGIAALAVVTIIGLGYRHYTGLIDSVATLTANNAQLETAVGQQKQTIAAQQDAIGEWQQSQDELLSRVDELQAVAEEAAKETRRLNDIFARHDLTELARRKPGLIERRINSGTRAAGRMLECASGARGADCPDGAGAPAGEAPASQP